eukprot:CAMPEP_0170612688 /NCGR_PEP_ID=MMETSP0224-20130122/23860_1 /TAXON_ID=285029 /ORGANISM="Togula jolla, Strain CCCM 725" /LENGTH=202 /DNA_ID=CAMNT_0010938215 /DNA_START=45 /DNA_END=653 /DNA_ORIENTATION=+
MPRVQGVMDSARETFATPDPPLPVAGSRVSAQRHVSLFHRTKMCNFNALGRCLRGKVCRYAHSVDELNPYPNLACTKMCQTLLQDGVCNDEECMFAHSRGDLRDPYRPAAVQKLQVRAGNKLDHVVAVKLQQRPDVQHKGDQEKAHRKPPDISEFVAALVNSGAFRVSVKNTFLCIADEDAPSARTRARTAHPRLRHRGENP